MLKIARGLQLPDEAVTQTFAILADRPYNLYKRFCRQIKVTGDCWLWLGYKKNGYGAISINDRDVYCHRLAYEAYNGPLSDGVVILHSCDTPACVCPAHLIAGSQLDNIKDMQAKGRAVNPPTHYGLKHPNATLSDSTIVEIKADKNTPQRILAKKYGVSQSTIWRIRHGVTRKISGQQVRASDNLFVGGTA